MRRDAATGPAPVVIEQRQQRLQQRSVAAATGNGHSRSTELTARKEQLGTHNAVCYKSHSSMHKECECVCLQMHIRQFYFIL